MKNRVEQLVSDQTTRYLWMGTFHSVFARILRREHQAAQYPPTFTIYDTDDSKSLIKQVIRDLKLNEQVYVPGELMRRISMAKNHLITPESYASRKEWVSADESARKPETARIYAAYAGRCKAAGAMDFDDLLMQTYLLFRDHPDILSHYQSQFRYILVDEYQDTNYAQYMIIRQLSALNGNICVVGDDSQSIYSFRGARIENILNFRNDYPNYQIFKLEQNYRSTKNIVDTANSLISNNSKRIPKKIWSDKERGEPVDIVEASTDQEEGFLIASQILETHLRHQAEFQDFVILYRTHAQSRVLEEACRKQNIPYRIYGSISFYQRKEIKDVLAYFRILVNPKDDESIRRIINYPARGIGKTTMERLNAAALQHQTGLLEILKDPAGYVPQLNRGTQDKLQKFLQLIDELTAYSHSVNAYELALKVIRESGIMALYRYDHTPEGISKFENIQELINGIREYVDQQNDNLIDMEEQNPGMAGFLQNIALLTDQDQEKPEDRNKVSLMTIHSAKGLEFKYVFIAGVEEDLFPNQFSAYSARELEEERRLFYVALTRGMVRVSVSYAKTRYRWGNLISSAPSRFIRELDPRYIRLQAGRFSEREQLPTETGFVTAKRDQSGDWPGSRPIPRRTRRPHTEPVNFTPDDPEAIQAGMEIEHPRFGTGKVLKIEGEAPNRKAIVFFTGAGQKQLLLKFARLRIIKP